MTLDKIWLALDIAEKAGVAITLRAEELRPVVEAIEALHAENTRLRTDLASLEMAEAEGDKFRAEYHKQMQEQVDKLRAALEQVEWVGHNCPWCKEVKPTHEADCARQAALA